MNANRFRFRAWDRENNKIHYFTKLNICDNCIVFDNENFDLGNNHNDDENAVVMQSTGLCDKNGKEVFEGDIVKVDEDWEVFGFMAGEIREVYFMDGGFRLKPKITKDNRGRGHWIEDGKNLTIIGNTYENPNLINADEERKQHEPQV